MRAEARGKDLRAMMQPKEAYQPTDYRKEVGLPGDTGGGEDDGPTWTQRAGAAGRQITRAAGRALTFGVANQAADAVTKFGAVPAGTPGVGAKLREMFFGNVMDRGDGSKGYTNTLYNDKESEDADSKLAPGVGTAAEIGMGFAPGGMAREIGAGVERLASAVPRLASRGLPAAAETVARGAATGATTGAAYSAANAGAAGDDVGAAAARGAEGGGALGAGAGAVGGAGRAASGWVRNPNSRSGELIDRVERVGGEARPSGVKGGAFDATGPREEGTSTLLSQARQGPKATSDIAKGRPLPGDEGTQRGVAHEIVDDLGDQHAALNKKFGEVEGALLADHGNVQSYPSAAIGAVEQQLGKKVVNDVQLPGANRFTRFQEALGGGASGREPTIEDLVNLRREADHYVKGARLKGFKDTDIPWIKVRSAIAEDIAAASSEVAKTDQSPDDLGKLYREHAAALDQVEKKSYLATGKAGAVPPGAEARQTRYRSTGNKLSREGTEGVAAANAEIDTANLRKMAPEYGPGIDRIGAAAAREALRFNPKQNPFYNPNFLPMLRAAGVEIGSDAVKARLVDPAGRAVSGASAGRAGVTGGTLMSRLRSMAGAKDEPPSASMAPDDQRELEGYMKKQEAQ